MWIEHIAKYSQKAEVLAKAETPAIEACEKAVGVALPAELRGLLLETNGVRNGFYAKDVIWSAERIMRYNVQRRAENVLNPKYMSFGSLLFIGSQAAGAEVAYAIAEVRIVRPDIYLWEPLNDMRLWIAPNLRLYLKGAFSGDFCEEARPEGSPNKG